ncbi:MAG: DUF2520 domain-containing protein [Bacteroidales bacterium]|nr:DUF2520 domain-containing protein [Bacteroidales bacterium]
MKALSDLKLVFIGAGNLATNLAIAFFHQGLTISLVYSRTKASAKNLAEKINARYTDDLSTIHPDADVYFICVSDNAIESIITQHQWDNALVVHTAGSTGMDILAKASQNIGVFYPLQTFSKSRLVCMDNVPVCLEASNEDTLQMIQELAGCISDEIYFLNSDQRLNLHIAAVFACNFTNHMYAISDYILKEKMMDFKLLYPLIRENTLKLSEVDPVAGQTGPARRKDMEVVAKHIEALKNHEEWQNLYKNLTDSIINLHDEYDKH